MAVPSLKLDLAPPSTFWRLNHALLGWTALGVGALVLASSIGLTARAWSQASRAGKLAVLANVEKTRAEDAQNRILDELRAIDVARELPRWKLAERIFTERSLPWSRLTAELERSLVQDVRLKSLQRSRGSDMKVQVKIKGEAQSRAAEAAFMQSLQKNTFFEQVILEREGERQGGGVEFECTLAAQSTPPPYTPLPKHGPPVKASATPAPAAVRSVAVPAPRNVQPAMPPGRAFPPATRPQAAPGNQRPAVPAPFTTRQPPAGIPHLVRPAQPGPRTPIPGQAAPLRRPQRHEGQESQGGVS
jgi:hypothetical protein